MPERKRVLIVGGGSIGERHLRCFVATGRADVALCEINPQLRARIAAQYPLADSYADLPAALAWDCDAAVVATPAHLHIAMARQLVAAGRHVLIEKPLSTSLDGVDELAHEARRADRIVGLAYVLRHNPGMVALRDAVRGGRWGTPLEVTFVGGQDFPFYRPAYREIYYRDRATGGGAIQDALTHMLNAVEWIVGPLASVAADAAHLRLEGVDVEDTVHAIARHQHGTGEVLASYALNQHQAPNESTLSIVCSEGLLRLELHRQRWSSIARGEADRAVHAYENPDRDTGFIAQAQAFLDALEGRGAVSTSLDEGRQTLLGCLAILQAADERRWVDVATRVAEEEMT